MRCLSELPEGYSKILSIDFQKDKKLMLRINAAALIAAAVMGFAAGLIMTKEDLLNFGAVKILITLAAMLIYLVLHEFVHGMTMKLFGSKTLKYGFTGIYAYAGSSDYFNRNMYAVTALAPVVIWGIVLLILNLICGSEWFLAVYLIQICNIAGSVGDMYVVSRLTKLPKDVLILDSGVAMEFYSKE